MYERRIIEQYKTGGEGKTDWIQGNRLRYMVRVQIPLFGKTLEEGEFFVETYNEVFINFGQNTSVNIFDQNRFYLGLGYSFGPAGRLIFGYMYQILEHRDGKAVEYNNTLVVSFNSDLDLFKKKK